MPDLFVNVICSLGGGAVVAVALIKVLYSRLEKHMDAKIQIVLEKQLSSYKSELERKNDAYRKKLNRQDEMSTEMVAALVEAIDCIGYLKSALLQCLEGRYTLEHWARKKGNDLDVRIDNVNNQMAKANAGFCVFATEELSEAINTFIIEIKNMFSEFIDMTHSTVRKEECLQRLYGECENLHSAAKEISKKVHSTVEEG